MKSTLVILLFFVCGISGNAQTVSLLSVDQLNQRLTNGGDTTYVINFWATWCAPCVKELPYFEKLPSQFKNEPIKVLLVSVDSKTKLKSAVQPFVQRKKLKSEIYLLDEDDPQTYIDRIDKRWEGSIPATLFVRKGSRKFLETEFTYKELITAYQNFKKS